MDAMQTAVDVVRKNPVVCLATTDGTKPRARYIMVRDVDDALTLTLATGLTDMKCVHIRKNPHVHVTAGFPAAEPNTPQVSIDAVATIHVDQATREKYWEESFLEHFPGPDHEHYVILKIRPTRAWLSTGEEIEDFQELQP